MEEEMIIKPDMCEVVIKTEDIDDSDEDKDKDTLKFSDENPWAVDSLNKFLFFNCPECDFKVQDQLAFQYHAIESHYQVHMERISVTTTI
jgi:hypothetical protein